MKILKTAQYNLRYPDEINDDLGLSPDWGQDPYEGPDIDPEEANMWNMQQRGEGQYYSITNDNPVGPFKTTAEAKASAEQAADKIVSKTMQEVAEGQLASDRKPEEEKRFWLENTEFYTVWYDERGNAHIEPDGNFYEV